MLTVMNDALISHFLRVLPENCNIIKGIPKDSKIPGCVPAPELVGVEIYLYNPFEYPEQIKHMLRVLH
jgi:Ni,Fe-hydrogenase III small subunit